ncbi:DNA utilization protein GntX [Actinomadura rubteroloni]|uniref:DNA utilization protein GntX n=2 Tax=Actinomadura rubteroloni TaxID=1926885 RepID=A0A2P4UPQ7_9ACTN|nr:DNA utilization protein GntX [Actinomadura rubteroloni]
MSFLHDLLDLIVPETCAGCGRDGAALCRICAVPLTLDPRPAPLPVRPSGVRCWTVADYAGTVRKVINAHKEQGRTPLTRPLAEALTRALRAAQPPPATPGEASPPTLTQELSAPLPRQTANSSPRGIVPKPSTPRTRGTTSPQHASPSAPAGPDRIHVVPIPSARRAVRRRGDDPMLNITRTAVRTLTNEGLAFVLTTALKQARPVADQAALTRTERIANLKGALAATRPLDGARVIVVDDIVTTGATLTEAVRTLRRAGAHVLAAATIAATTRTT